MPSVRRFSVTSGDQKPASFDTFAAAERRALDRFKSGDVAVTIRDDSGEALAIIRSDALGRIWTDLTWIGAASVGRKR
jgi:hypothetical protein